MHLFVCIAVCVSDVVVARHETISCRGRAAPKGVDVAQLPGWLAFLTGWPIISLGGCLIDYSHIYCFTTGDACCSVSGIIHNLNTNRQTFPRVKHYCKENSTPGSGLSCWYLNPLHIVSVWFRYWQVLSQNKKCAMHYLLCSWGWKWSDWKRWIWLMPGTSTLILDGDHFRYFPIETFRNCVCELHMERKLLSLCQWTSRCEDANARAETNLSILIDYRIYFILWRGDVYYFVYYVCYLCYTVNC